jgi:putative ABC transport system ATP-binding protein
LKHLDTNDIKPLVCKGISKDYRLGGSVIHALRQTNLEVGRGELVSIMGPSGSGKSTLLHIAGTLDRTDTGKLFIDGQDVTALPESQLSVVRRERVGFVFQFFNLATQLTAVENVSLPMLLSGRYTSNEATSKAEILLRLTGLPDNRHRNTPRQLSGGQQQMVAVARSLANDPAFILADEPTGNLDADSSAKVMSIIRSLNAVINLAVIIVTHNPEVAAHANTVRFMRDGELMNTAPEPFLSSIRAARREKLGPPVELGATLSRLFEIEEGAWKRRFVDGQVSEEKLVQNLERLEKMRQEKRR